MLFSKVTILIVTLTLTFQAKAIESPLPSFYGHRPDSPSYYLEPHSPRADRSRSKDFTNEQLKHMGFRLDCHHPPSEQELLDVKSSVTRSRMQRPDDERLSKVSGKRGSRPAWVPSGETNAQYVDRKMSLKREQNRRRADREKDLRDTQEKLTGVRPRKSKTELLDERLRRARAGRKDDIVQFRTSLKSGILFDDRKKRTNGEYIRAYEEHRRIKSKEYYWRKKMRIKRPTL